MVETPSAPEALRIVEGLLRQGVIARPLHQFGLPNCIRISTGTDHQMRRCVEALQAVMATAAR